MFFAIRLFLSVFRCACWRWGTSLYFAYVRPQSWADAFRSSPSLVGVVCVYDDLRKRGLEFPMTDLDAMSPIHTPNRVSLPPQTWLGQCPRPRCLPLHAHAIFAVYRVFQRTGAQKDHLTSPAHSSRHLKHLPVFPVRILHPQFSQVKDRHPSLHNRYCCQMYQKSRYGPIRLDYNYWSESF